MIKSIALGLVALVMVAAAASATTLSATGSVMVNRGDGFKPVSGSVEVRPGDRILVGANSFARLAYSQTCVTEIAPHATVSVLSSAPCTGRMNAGGPRGNRPVENPVNTEVSNPVIGDAALAVPFGAMIAGGIVGFVIQNNSSRSNPASP